MIELAFLELKHYPLDVLIQFWSPLETGTRRAEPISVTQKMWESERGEAEGGEAERGK